MKKVGFIGVYDKTNLILSIAKILTMKQKKVLVIDSTYDQKLKYIVPTIHPTKTYITTWEDIDVAVGFNSIEEIYKYIGGEDEIDYDVVLMNIDRAELINDMEVLKNDINYFVTSMDLYSIRKGIEIFSKLKQSIFLEKIVFSREMNDIEEEYIEYMSKGYPINWQDSITFFPLILEDRYVEMDNQLIYKIDLKSISQMYKTSLAHLVAIMFKGTISEVEARRILKTLEKDGV